MKDSYPTADQPNDRMQSSIKYFDYSLMQPGMNSAMSYFKFKNLILSYLSKRCCLIC